MYLLAKSKDNFSFFINLVYDNVFAHKCQIIDIQDDFTINSKPSYEILCKTECVKQKLTVNIKGSRKKEENKREGGGKVLSTKDKRHFLEIKKKTKKKNLKLCDIFLKCLKFTEK